MAVSLSAKVRNERGSRAARRLREHGLVPAILYGHGQESVSLSVPGEQIQHIVHQGTKLVDLTGDVADTALIRDVQWDTFGGYVLHLDFYRVSAGELVETTLTVVLRGEAPGVKAGGLVEQVQHELEIECPVSSLPDRLELNIKSLELGGAIHAREVPLPEGAQLLSDPDSVIVHCVMPLREEEVEAPAAPAEAGEPEVIGRKPAEDEEGEE